MPICMKLFIDKKGNKVLFAEADKAFVDFLIHALQLPVARLVACISKEPIEGSLGCLHKSLKALSPDYIQPYLKKDNLLWPRVASGSSEPYPFYNIREEGDPKYCFYRCPNKSKLGSSCVDYVSESSVARCPSCRDPMNQCVKYVATPDIDRCSPDQEGYVKRLFLYLVTDDLAVKPMSNSSSCELLKLNVSDLNAVEVREVKICSISKGLALLRASMVSKTVLTDVFLRSKDD